MAFASKSFIQVPTSFVRNIGRPEHSGSPGCVCLPDNSLLV